MVSPFADRTHDTRQIFKVKSLNVIATMECEVANQPMQANVINYWNCHNYNSTQIPTKRQESALAIL
jgi:hypothetical protein